MAIGGDRVREHPALTVSAEVHVSAGQVPDAVDDLAGRDDVIGECALQPTAFMLGCAEVDHPRVDALLVEHTHRRRR